MELTHADSGCRRDVRVGDEVTIALAESPTTGYRWYTDVDSALLRQTDDHFDGSAERRGAGGTRRLTFTILRPGLTHLKLVKRRSWETAIVEEFIVELETD